MNFNFRQYFDPLRPRIESKNVYFPILSNKVFPKKKIKNFAILKFIQSSAAETRDVEGEEFIPQVAFNCGYKNQYLQKNGFWKTDTDKYATCLKGKLDILKYCRKVSSKVFFKMFCIS